MSSSRESARAMANAIFAECREVPGHGWGIDPERLRRLITTDPDAVAEAFPFLLETIKQTGQLWRLAEVVAATYAADPNGDDSLEMQFRQALKETGKEALPPARVVPDETAERRPDGLVSVVVAGEDLGAGSAFRMASLWGFPGQNPEALRRAIGRLALTFPLDHDPRHVWDIPEVRKFMRDLHTRLPYFPMYLDLRPELFMFVVYFGSLADEAARRDGSLDICHDSVTDRLVETIVAVHRVLGESDGRPIVEGLLNVYPPELRGAFVGQ